MANMVKSESYGVEKHILIANNSYMATLGARISDAGVTAANGKKIVKAGTPLYGNIEKRDTAFTVSGEGSVSAILLHDVDVTEGASNGTLVLAGVVDLLKLESDVKTKITSAVKTALPRIIFVEGSAI